MNKMFESLKKGLEEAIAFEKGELKDKTATHIIKPIKNNINIQDKKNINVI